MTGRLRISVVIPVRDDASALAEALDLLARQIRFPDEIVVVDNGSRDGTAEVARRAGARVVTVPRPGVALAAAAGYDAAAGDVLARCDADTRMPRDWLSRIERAFAADPDLEGLTGPGRFYDLPRGISGLAAFGYAVGYFLGAGSAIANVPLWGSNMALRATAWQRVSPAVHRRPDVHDDLDLSCRLGPRARVRFDPGLRVGVAGRIFASRATGRDKVNRAMRTLRLNWADQSAGLRWVERVRGRSTIDAAVRRAPTPAPAAPPQIPPNTRAASAGRTRDGELPWPC